MRYREVFQNEYIKRTREALRLRALCADAIWYNHDRVLWGSHHHSPTLCHTSMYGHRVRDEDDSYQASFPVWYEGPSLNAPVLPRAILQTEVDMAEKEAYAAREQIEAPWDWAPGGCKYKAMLRDPEGGCSLYNLLNSNQ